MTAKESIFGVLACVFLILCILNREIITFIPFYVFPILFFSFISAFFFAVPTDPEDSSIDYKDAAVRLFIAASVSILLLLSLGERSYDQEGKVMRAETSQEINETYNSWTRRLVMGINVFRPSVYKESNYDSTTLLKIIALSLALGGPLMSLSFLGWYLPNQKEKKETKKTQETDEKKENLYGDIRRLQNIKSDLETEISKRNIEIQALRAENRNLKKKLGND